MSEKLKTLLTIAGSDPTGGAGIQTDLRIGTTMGLHVLTAITALTSQNSKGFYSYGAVEPKLLRSQINSILDDVLPDAVKIGMVGSAKNIFVIEEFLKALPSSTPIVVDPILAASVDNAIEDEATNDLINSYRHNIFPLATVVTPNIDEALHFSGQDENFILSNLNLLPSLLNTKAIVLTGINNGNHDLIDILITRDDIIERKHKRIQCKNLHGTGCAFSSLLASCLALGNNLTNSFIFSSDKMNGIISHSCSYSLGNSDYGPLNINVYKL